ncbi:MAG TPA: hypothetical protein VGF84_01630 [Micromonosporaceae bacterium]
MTNNVVRTDYRGEVDLPELLYFCQRIWTVDNRWHVGDLAWDIGLTPEVTDEWRIALWRRDGQAIAAGWLTRPDQLSVVIGPDDAGMLGDVIAWADDLAGAAVAVTVLDSEAWLVDDLVRRGYTADLGGHFFLAMQRDIADLEPVPALPEGFTVRPVRESELGARAELHRRVWSSRMSDETYRAMASRRPYRIGFDWVAVAPGGELVSYVLGWYDEIHRIGEFEPVGTLTEFRRMGLSHALGIALMHAFRAAGGERALVYARGDDEYPTPRQVYGALGFEVHGRTVKYQPKR